MPVRIRRLVLGQVDPDLPVDLGGVHLVQLGTGAWPGEALPVVGMIYRAVG